MALELFEKSLNFPRAGTVWDYRALLALLMGDAQPAQAVPATALNSTGGDHVFVLAANGSVHRVAVEVVSRGNREVVVKTAVPLEQVVDYPSASLVEGTPVSVK